MAYTLQLLHASDLEGGVDAIVDAPNFAAVVQGLETDAAARQIDSILLSAGDNYLPGPFFSAAGDGAVRDTLQSFYNNFFGLTDESLDIREGVGRIDISNMNAIGFDASAIGNHEFDAGTSTVEDIIGTDIRGETPGDVRWLGTQFPYLSTNLDFSASNLDGLFTEEILPSTAFQSTPADLTAAGEVPKIAPATIIERSGERIGVVAATTPLVETISSTGDVQVRNPGAGTNDMAALASVLQPTIDAVAAQGVNKILLVTHLQQIQLEQELATLLRGVDIIVAGGSDTILANADDRLRPGDTAGESYPLLTQNADGQPVAIVSTDGEYSYVGRLVAEFDDAGVLNPASIDPALSGPFATDEQGVSELWSALAPGQDPFGPGTKGGAVRNLTSAVQGVVTAADSNAFGATSVFIEGSREKVRTEETTLGNLSADANLAFAQGIDPTVTVSLKNGGGIRAPIGEIVGNEGLLAPPVANPISGKDTGRVSQLDIENSLRFNNDLAALTVTATQLKQIVEHGVAATAPGVTPGQFPQIGGMAFSFDPNGQAIEFALSDDGETVTGVATDGSRVRSLAILDGNGNIVDTVVAGGQVTGNPNRPIRLVTLGFLADGGDAYPFPFFQEQNSEFFNRVDFADQFEEDSQFSALGTEQRALADFLAQKYSAAPFAEVEVGPERDLRIQNLSVRSDTVLQSQFFDLTVNADNVDLATIALAQTTDGVTSVALDADVLQTVGLTLTGTEGTVAPASDAFQVGFDIAASSDFTASADGGDLTPLFGTIAHGGTVTFNDSVTVGNFAIRFDARRQTDSASGFFIVDTFGTTLPVFDIGTPSTVNLGTGSLTLGADLLVSPELANFLEAPSAAGADVGDAQVDATLSAIAASDLLAQRPGGVRGLTGNDAIAGTASGDLLNGNNGNDTLTGASGNDVLYGGRGNDVLTGGDGDDFLSGDQGQDTLTGGAGNDVFLLRTSSAVPDASLADLVADFGSGDAIALTGPLTEESLILTASGSDTVVRIADDRPAFLGVVANVTPADLASRFVTATDLGLV